MVKLPAFSHYYNDPVYIIITNKTYTSHYKFFITIWLLFYNNGGWTLYVTHYTNHREHYTSNTISNTTKQLINKLTDKINKQINNIS